MSSSNIQIGIDLGTTNSESAVNSGETVEIIKNIWQDEYTPSVFGFDKSKNKVVGKKAYEKLFKDGSPEEEKNYKCEVKRLMGTPDKVEFPNAGVDLNAEEISSEILKSMKEDIQRKHPEVIPNAAVITVPAYFSTLQKEATKRSGKLAGFDYVVLLQEPIAAAMSYGFGAGKDENIIVYDLGGGTFDVAVVSSKDGVLTVLNQEGDNFLGGKDIDNSILENILLPKIEDKYGIILRKSDPNLKSVFAKLKYIAEKAKIELSQLKTTNVEIDITDKSLEAEENNIFLSFELSRPELEKEIIATINKTIKILESAIKGSGLKKEGISRIVLVGGPTQMPLIRKMLEEKTLIKVDSSSDPLTAVARGAAIFGLSQRIPEEILKKNKPKSKEVVELKIYYDGLTSDDEQLITGIVKNVTEEGWHLQIQSESGYFNSQKIPVNGGKFKTTVKLEPGKNNLLWVYLFNSKSEQIPVFPESISITHGLTVSNAQISHSIGLALVDVADSHSEEMDFFFKKGDHLPLTERKSYHTAKRLKKGDKSNNLNIKCLEGESRNPIYNDFLASTAITGDDLPHDIPEGTDIDITINVDQSNVVTIEWYLPIIDKGGNFRQTLMNEALTCDDLEKALQIQREKAESIKDNCSSEERQIIDEKISEVGQTILNAEVDEDEARKANKELKELGRGLEEISKSKEMPTLKEEYKEKVKLVKNAIEEVGLDEEKDAYRERLTALESEGKEAITENDKMMLSETVSHLIQLGVTVVYSNPQTWVWKFNEIKEGTYSFSDQTEADYYITKGDKAIADQDIDGLKASVVGLESLLSSTDVKEIDNKRSGIMR
jgi:molecular chaperone DnaK